VPQPGLLRLQKGNGLHNLVTPRQMHEERSPKSGMETSASTERVGFDATRQ
jgi:hypothetical protein